MTCLPAAILQALRLRETEAAAALICHMAASDPEGAQRIRAAVVETEARLRARRGALRLEEHLADEDREYRDAMNREWWDGEPFAPLAPGGFA